MLSAFGVEDDRLIHKADSDTKKRVAYGAGAGVGAAGAGGLGYAAVQGHREAGRLGRAAARHTVKGAEASLKAGKQESLQGHAKNLLGRHSPEAQAHGDISRAQQAEYVRNKFKAGNAAREARVMRLGSRAVGGAAGLLAAGAGGAGYMALRRKKS